MALSDLLWTCPTCGPDHPLEPVGDEHRCAACQTSFRRAVGGRIAAVGPGGEEVFRTAAEWVDRLPSPETLLETADAVVRAGTVEFRRVVGTEPVYGEHGYLNRIERFGPEARGRLELRPDRLILRPEGSETEEWPFGALTAVQASSSTLQIKVRDRPLVAFRFRDDSIYLWELLLNAALRAFYRRTGRGEIAEFQPRIVIRPH